VVSNQHVFIEAIVFELVVLEFVSRRLVKDVSEGVFVFVVRELVVECAHALMSPQSDQEQSSRRLFLQLRRGMNDFVRQTIFNNANDALEHARKLTNVK